MRKVIVISMITLDGVMQAPGGPEEDRSGGFRYGGWIVPYVDGYGGQVMDEQLGHPFDLLLGRKTYDIWKPYWPQHKDGVIGAGFNRATKYVATTTLTESDWEKTVILKDNVVNEIKKFKKQSDGPELQVHGSGNFIQTLLKNDLVDELWLKIFPITLGASLCGWRDSRRIYFRRLLAFPEWRHFGQFETRWRSKDGLILKKTRAFFRPSPALPLRLEPYFERKTRH